MITRGGPRAGEIQAHHLLRVGHIAHRGPRQREPEAAEVRHQFRAIHQRPRVIL
jgi:hypothetical protein